MKCSAVSGLKCTQDAAVFYTHVFEWEGETHYDDGYMCRDHAATLADRELRDPSTLELKVERLQ